MVPRKRFQAVLWRDDGDVEVEVTYEVTPYWPALYGQPEEGGDVDVLKTSIPVTEDEETEIRRQIDEYR